MYIGIQASLINCTSGVDSTQMQLLHCLDPQTQSDLLGHIEAPLLVLSPPAWSSHHLFLPCLPPVRAHPQIPKYRSQGVPSGPTSSWGPFGPLDFVLHGIRALSPCDPRRKNGKF